MPELRVGSPSEEVEELRSVCRQHRTSHGIQPVLDVGVCVCPGATDPSGVLGRCGSRRGLPAQGARRTADENLPRAIVAAQAISPSAYRDWPRRGRRRCHHRLGLAVTGWREGSMWASRPVRTYRCGPRSTAMGALAAGRSRARTSSGSSSAPWSVPGWTLAAGIPQPEARHATQAVVAGAPERAITGEGHWSDSRTVRGYIDEAGRWHGTSASSLGL